MLEEYKDLEWAVELVTDQGFAPVVAEEAVAVLAEPLRRAHRVGEAAKLTARQLKRIEELEAAYDYINDKSLKRLERIEELEAVVAAARDWVTARYDVGADYSGAVIRLRKAIKSLDAETKP